MQGGVTTVESVAGVIMSQYEGHMQEYNQSFQTFWMTLTLVMEE